MANDEDRDQTVDSAPERAEDPQQPDADLARRHRAAAERHAELERTADTEDRVVALGTAARALRETEPGGRE